MLLNPFRFSDSVITNFYNPAAIALFDRMIDIPAEIPWKNKINDFIVEGISQNIFQLFDALMVPKGMQDYTSACLDWKREVSAGIYGNADWDQINGFKSLDIYHSNTHIKTYYQPDGTGNYGLNACSIGVYVTDATPDSGTYATYFGAYGTGEAVSLANVAGSNYFAEIHSAGISGIGTSPSTGLIVLSRVNSTTWELYANGVLLGSYTATADNLPTVPFYLLAANPGNGSVYDMSRGIALGAWFAGGYLPPAKHNTLKTMFDVLWT